MVGDGSEIYVWADPWLPSIPGFKHTPLRFAGLVGKDYKVKDLIDSHFGQWNRPLIQASFSPSDAETILKIHLQANPRSDELLWVADKLGKFSVKSLY